jgi:hypothetical protein
MVLIAMNYANDLLGKKMAENEYSTNQQFMRTAGQQIDDIAWIIGRTQTVSYASKFGQVNFQPMVLNYTVEAKSNTTQWQTVGIYQTGIILFNTPVDSYSMGDNYFARIPYSANGSFLQSGSAAPVSQVFCNEKLGMTDGSYLRIVVVPTARALDSENFTKFYLPTLVNGTHLYHSQSVTLSGSGISKSIKIGVDQVRFNVTFPKAALGYDQSFFKFDHLSEIKFLPHTSVVEFYVGTVTVTIGQVYGG